MASFLFRHFSRFVCAIVLWIYKRKGVFTLKRLGTITVSVFEKDDKHTDFCVETDDEDVLPVSYIIEDTLKLY